MLHSETNITFENKEEVKQIIKKTLKNSTSEKDTIQQISFLHKTELKFQEKSASIKVSFSKNFYIIAVITFLFFLFLPKESSFIWSSALAIVVIVFAVLYFSLDYKLKTVLDGFS